MPENSLNFVQIKKDILEAAPMYGVTITVRRAKALAGRYIAEQDAELDDGRTDYADPTGTEAVRRWMKAWIDAMDVEQVAA